jgi:hypothetical protein
MSMTKVKIVVQIAISESMKEICCNHVETLTYVFSVLKISKSTYQDVQTMIVERSLHKFCRFESETLHSKSSTVKYKRMFVMFDVSRVCSGTTNIRLGNNIFKQFMVKKIFVTIILL